MHVCMLAYSFYESDTRIRQYSTALKSRGDTVDVIALKKHNQANHELLSGVNVYRIQERAVNERSGWAYLSRILRFFFYSAIVLTRRHCAKRYDVIHVHSVPDFLVFAAIVPKILGARVILDIHDILPEFYASKFKSDKQSLIFRLLILVERVSIAFSDHTIVANHIWRERLLSRSARPDKCSTIENYPDLKVFVPALRKSEGEFRIIYPGTLNRHQGVDVAIQAYAKVADLLPDSRFDIYGDGPEKQFLIKLTHDLGLRGRVHFHDFLPTDAIAPIMAAASLAIVPKRASSAFGTEAASTKIMEFMAMKVPVIVARTKIDCLTFNDSLVRFFCSENCEDLAACILEMKLDHKLRMRIVRNAARHINLHSWESEKQIYLRIVDSGIKLAASMPTRESAKSCAESSYI